MNLFKRLLPLMAAMILSISASATVKYVIVNDGDSQNTVFALEEQPTVTFNSTDLIITAGEKTVRFALTEKLSFTFSEDVTAIDQILAQPNNISFSWNGQNVEIAGLTPGSRVALYQADGKMLKTVVSDVEGRINLNVEQYNGVFIIGTETKAFKIAK